MSTLVSLYCEENSLYAFEKVFDGKSAFQKVLEWAEKIEEAEILVFLTEKNKNSVLPQIEGKKLYLVEKDFWNLKEVLEESYKIAEKTESSDVIFSFADVPFINFSLTKEIISRHKKYNAEYSFADGYPYGLSPEVLAKDTVKILLNLAEKNPLYSGKEKIERTSIFSLLKTEINSFEIETVISQNDFRMHRLSFECSSKQGFISCKNLFKMKIPFENAEEISENAVKNIDVLKTVPSYYSLQISEKCSGKCFFCPYSEKISGKKSENFMDFNKFSNLVKKISSFSGSAVISLSSWGESLFHPEFEKFVLEILKYDGLSVLIETDGLLIDERLCENIQKAAEGKKGFSSFAKIMWIVALDSFSPEKYSEIRGLEKENYFTALNSVKMLEKYFPNSVYPQMTRLNQNEDELESFYRFWSAKDSFSSGNLIVQKYDDFSKTLPDLRPADISPLERNVCWHLLRDMNIFYDGEVSLCHEILKNQDEKLILGNVFTDGIEKIWKKQTEFAEMQIEQNYIEKCRKCDEFYTFNF